MTSASRDGAGPEILAEARGVERVYTLGAEQLHALTWRRYAWQSRRVHRADRALRLRQDDVIEHPGGAGSGNGGRGVPGRAAAERAFRRRPGDAEAATRRYRISIVIADAATDGSGERGATAAHLRLVTQRPRGTRAGGHGQGWAGASDATTAPMSCQAENSRGSVSPERLLHGPAW